MGDLIIVMDCSDVAFLAPFWCAALDYEQRSAPGAYRELVSRVDDGRPRILLQAVSEPKVLKNRMHLDITADDIETECARLIGLGATRSSEVIAENGMSWIVMADPEGNEFCVIRG